ASECSAQDHDRVDLERRAARQGRDLDRRTRRVRFREVFGHYRVDLRELRQVGQVQADADDVVEAAAGRLAHRLEVVEGAACLVGDVAVYQVAGGRIDRHLARTKHHARTRRAAGAGRLGVWTDGRGCAVSVDGLSGHGPILQPLHAVHHAQAADLANHVGDVAAVAHLDGEADLGDVAVAFQVFDPVDVRLGLGDCRGHLGQHSRPVLDLDHQRAVEISGDIAVPADRDPALGRLAV